MNALTYAKNHWNKNKKTNQNKNPKTLNQIYQSICQPLPRFTESPVVHCLHCFPIKPYYYRKIIYQSIQSLI